MGATTGMGVIEAGTIGDDRGLTMERNEIMKWIKRQMRR